MVEELETAEKWEEEKLPFVIFSHDKEGRGAAMCDRICR